MDRNERAKYEDSLKYYRDLKNSLDTAFDDGKKEGYDELLPLLQQERQKVEQKKQKHIRAANFLKSLNVEDEILAKKNGLIVDLLNN